MSFAGIAAGVGAAASVAGAATSASAAGGASAKQMAMQKELYRLAQQRYQEYMQQAGPYARAGRKQLKPWQESMDAYQSAIPGYFDQLGQYQGAVDDYRNKGIGGVNAAVDMYQSAIPELTREYGMEQYRNSPLYTPMVNNLAELEATPGYQFQLAQGQKAIAQQAAARGGMLSGAQLQAAQQFGQQQAATGFQAAWERAQSAFKSAFNQDLQSRTMRGNVLKQNVDNNMQRAGAYQTGANLAGQGAQLYGQGLGYMNQNVANRLGGVNMGMNAVNAMGQMGLQSTGMQGEALTGYGDAYANGQLGSAQAINNGIRGVGQGLMGIYGAGVNQGWWGNGQGGGLTDADIDGWKQTVGGW